LAWGQKHNIGAGQGEENRSSVFLKRGKSSIYHSGNWQLSQMISTELSIKVEGRVHILLVVGPMGGMIREDMECTG
jgi:hypothetical protein